MLGEEMSLLVEVRRIRAERLRGKAASGPPLPPLVTMSDQLWPDAAKRASSDAGLIRMTIGAAGFGAAVPVNVTLRA